MKHKNKPKKIYMYKICVVIIFSIFIIGILNIAPNYVKSEFTNKTNLVINNSNVTKNLKKDLIIDKDVVYISTKDIANFFDGNIFYDDKYNQIITSSETVLATLKINEEKGTINGAKLDLMSPAIKKDNQYYLPFSEISKNVYNVETKYIKDTNTVVLTSLDRELIYANSSKNNNIKYKPTFFSKNIEKVKKGDTLVVVKTSEENSKWTKVTTENGKIGYVKTKTLANKKKVREDFKIKKQIEGKVSMVWDYFSKYGSAPKRVGKIKGVNVVAPTFFSLHEKGNGSIIANIGKEGENYIKWAHANGYKVWPTIRNDEIEQKYISEIMNDYKLRENLINNILEAVVIFDLDGINLDFENMYEKDRDMFSRFVIELSPRLKELGKVLSVDVTAPDGSPDWSLCYDRNIIGNVADYIVFMAYDQTDKNSGKPGTTAGYDWVETNIKKFIKREEIKEEKIILGIPFYARIWLEEDGKIDTRIRNMKELEKMIPSYAKVEWDDSLKQHYAEYEKDGITYKVWIEDEKSIKAKLDLVNQYNLAGAAYWEKDRETEEIWNIVSKELNIK